MAAASSSMRQNGAKLSRRHRQASVVATNNVTVGTNGGTQVINVIVEAIHEPEALRGMVMIVFTDVAAPTAKDTPSKSATPASTLARQELQQTRQELQTFKEEMQTSQEELQSSNEELQSTNEELTTSKEEMQSLERGTSDRQPGIAG